MSPSTESITSIDDKPIVLLSCVKSKRDYACAAKDMYISQLFQKMSSYSTSLRPKRIFILSAKYGLLKPDDIIEPYEMTLNNMKSGEKRLWAETVLSKLRHETNLQTDRFVFLAGIPYREGLIPHLRRYEVPMLGLPFGRQLEWLKARGL